MNSQETAIGLYQAIAADDAPRVMNAWHASSIAKCPREQYFMRKAVPFIQRPSAAMMLRWKAGHLIEEVVRPYLKQMMPNLQSNIRLESKDLDLTGEYDNYDPDTQTIWEIKSVSTHAVRYRKKEEDRHNLRDDKPYLHHEWQEHAYVLLMAEQGIEVKHIGYMYITLDGLLVPYLTEVQPELLAQVKARITGLNHYWKLQELPPCFCLDENHQFAKGVHQYCNYREDGICCNPALLEGIRA